MSGAVIVRPSGGWLALTPDPRLRLTEVVTHPEYPTRVIGRVGQRLTAQLLNELETSGVLSVRMTFQD